MQYEKAIVESGAYNTGASTLEAAQTAYVSLLGKLQCSDLDCMLAKDAADVEKAGRGSWGPVVDGVSLKAAPTDLIYKGEYTTKVPVLIGSNRDEEAFFTVLEYVNPKLTEAGLDKSLAKSLNASTIATLKKIYYPKGGYVYPQDLGKYSIWYWMGLRISTDHVPGLGACVRCSVA